MFYLEFNIINFLIVVVIAHFCSSFGAWFIHLLLHKKVLGIPFYRVHVGAHHRIDHISDYRLDHLSVLEHIIWTFLIIVYTSFCYFIGYSYFFTFLLWTFWVSITVAIINLGLDYYLHLQFETKESWLKNYSWFTTGQKLHRIHHSYLSSSDYSYESLTKIKNYAIGGPITGALMDRLFGTYEPDMPTNSR